MATNVKMIWGRSTVDTACPLDCPDSCSVSVAVENGRVASIDGSERATSTNGYICAKVRKFGERVYGIDRLLHPAVRIGAKGRGEFQRVSWDEAMALAARALAEARDQSGGESILPYFYGGSNGLVTQGTADALLFRRLGASRLARTLCAAPTGRAALAMYGKMPGVAYEDYPHARLIVVWGANPSVSHIHLVPHIREAQRQGARLVVIDPRQTTLARLADVHLGVRPGTDVAIALAIHRHLFESGLADEAFLAEHATGADRLRECARPWTFDRAAAVAGVDANLLATIAELYASTSPAVIRCGWGLERNRNGGNAALAVLALPTVAGKFGVRGGGYTMSNSAAWAVDPQAWLSTPEPSTRVVNMNHLGRALLEYDAPAVKALFVYNCNPVATAPDQNRVARGLAREDLFTIVFDQVMTDTARYADLLLPATTFLEHYDIARGYGAYHLQLVKPAIDAVGESRPNVEVFAELADRLGVAGDVGPDEGAALLAVAGGLDAAVRDAVLSDGRQCPVPPGGTTPVQFVDVHPRTADGRVQLHPEALAAECPTGLYTYRPDPASENYPLALISPATDKAISSTLFELQTKPAVLTMHPEDGAARGLEMGDQVRVFNDLGEVHCLLALSPETTRGVVVLPKGLWRRHTMNDATANALVPDTLSDLGGGACFNDARVEVARLVAARFEDHDLTVWTDAAGSQAVS
jgi:anaerobic selenocysteine-containing dehydrogenase